MPTFLCCKWHNPLGFSSLVRCGLQPTTTVLPMDSVEGWLQQAHHQCCSHLGQTLPLVWRSPCTPHNDGQCSNSQQEHPLLGHCTADRHATSNMVSASCLVVTQLQTSQWHPCCRKPTTQPSKGWQHAQRAVLSAQTMGLVANEPSGDDGT